MKMISRWGSLLILIIHLQDSNYIRFRKMLHLQIPVKAPDTARGELEITYLDEELRWVALYSRMFINCIKPCVPNLNFKLVYFHHVFILSHFDRVSRGDKGNLFILKMIDPSYRVPAWYAVSLSLYTIYR
jgi:hypothetical protein